VGLINNTNDSMNINTNNIKPQGGGGRFKLKALIDHTLQKI